MKKNFLYILGITGLLFFASCSAETVGQNDNGSNGSDTTSIQQPDSSNIPKDTIILTASSYVHDIDALPVITLEITTAEWNKLLSYYDQNSHNEEYVKADITFCKNADTTFLSDVGLRLRGNTSRRRPEGNTGEMHSSTNPNWHHASFGVNFKKFIKGQKIGGSEKINLKWFKDDGMYVREVYCYDLFKRFGVWTAPLSSYCRLYLKIKEDPSKTYYGVYQLLEPVDKEYVKRRSKGYPDSKGNLWKANYGADFVSTSRDNMGIENVTLTENYKPIYDLKTNEEKLEQAKDQLVNFIGNLNSKTGDNFKEWISSIMDVDLFLKTYAVNVTCGMWDDYWNNKNNFYFYFDSNGKFYFIPYDYDNSLGTSLIMNDAGKQDMLRWGNDGHPLVKKIIAIPEYKALYVSYIKELCNKDRDYFHVDKSIPRIQKWQSTISSYISNDTGEDMNLVDEPASWGNCPHYRLLDRNSQSNYFIVRANNIPK